MARCPGPTIEVNQGDTVRIIVENRLPNNFDSLAQPGDPGQPGRGARTGAGLHPAGRGVRLRVHSAPAWHVFLPTPHVAMQEAMGMVGLFIIHPRTAYEPVVDQDFAADHAGILDPRQYHDPRQPGNGLQFPDLQRPLRTAHDAASGQAGPPRADPPGEFQHGGPSSDSPARPHLRGSPEPRAGGSPSPPGFRATTCWSGVAQARDVEFIADNPGDWIMHCHMFHHTMNDMVSMAGP